MRAMRVLLLAGLLCLPAAVQADESPGGHKTTNSETVRGYLWYDVDCDGIREPTDSVLSESPHGGQDFTLFYIGKDGVPFTRDDTSIGLAGTINGGDHFNFYDGGADLTYYIAIRPAQRPPYYVPSPYRQGADRTVDNDLNLWPDGAWATGTFVIPLGTGFDRPPVTGIDIGLCRKEFSHRTYLPGVVRRTP